jgi:ketosteroid isomerase-like protein
MTAAEQIAGMVNKETHAWDTQDVEELLSLFHPDMVWPWPPTPHSHDPIDWVMELGKFNRERWGNSWRHLFATHRLVHNRRAIRRIEVSKEGDGALAVVDIDTLWRTQDGKDFHWKGRVCKVYSLVGEEWKLTMHTGALDYGNLT